MRRPVVLLALLAAAFALPSRDVAAQQAAQPQSLNTDIHYDILDTQKKIIALARAMPEDKFDWRPGPGVRSVREVFLHLASDNYLIPIGLGAPAPAASGVTSDFNTAVAFEKRAVGKDQVVADLEASFAHVHQALGSTVTDANMGETIKMFGQDFTRRRASLLLVTHLHEHLGQLIAYARTNGVVPPWSR